MVSTGLMSRWQPFVQLVLTRLREFYREPEVVFWVYGFPILLAVGLGVAFSNRAPERPVVEVLVVKGDPTELIDRLRAGGIEAKESQSREDCQQNYRTGKTSLYIIANGSDYTYVYDATREESVKARYQVDNILTRYAAGINKVTASAASSEAAADSQRWTNGKNTWQTTENLTPEPGNR
jgi:hypothetical protein